MKTREQKTTETDRQYLTAAARYCRKVYNRLREEHRPHYHHASHYASDAMRATEKRFVDLGTFGVEGWCDDSGRNGISYLNAGDTYAGTILFDSETERFSVGCWGDIAEKHNSDC